MEDDGERVGLGGVIVEEEEEEEIEEVEEEIEVEVEEEEEEEEVVMEEAVVEEANGGGGMERAQEEAKGGGEDVLRGEAPPEKGSGGDDIPPEKGGEGGSEIPPEKGREGGGGDEILPEKGEVGVDGTAVKNQAGNSSSAGKIFVGGVGLETTDDALASYFRKYGEISDHVIMKDRHNQKPRGFGFVTFIDPAVVDKVLEEEHVIDGKTVEVKRTLPREDVNSKGVPKTKKIFVGGIPLTLTEDQFKEHFSSYGKVVEHQILLDHASGRSRGFGFVTFENEDSVEKIISEGKMHDLGGKQVEIKKAEPKKSGTDSWANGRASYSTAGGSIYGAGGGRMYSAHGYGGGRSDGAYGFGGSYRSGGSGSAYYGAGAAGGYNRGYGAGYAGMGGYVAGAGAGYGGSMYGGGGGYAGGDGYGAGGYGVYGGRRGGGRGGGGGGYGGRYHPYGR